ncbi:MAG: hypothetical protein WA191_17310 [Telluria sp.]|nr:hypothetical protein [Telluria sp.]
MKSLFFLVSALVVQSVAFAQPATADCSGLLQPAVVNASLRTEQALAVASFFDSKLVSSEDKSKSLGINYGDISLDFKERDISQLRQLISKKLNYNYQSVADEKYLASFLTAEQLKHYVECKRFSDNNPHAELYWTDTLSAVAPGARPTRTINIVLMFVGNNVVPKYTLNLKVNGQTSKLLPSSWGNLKSTYAFMHKTKDISSPISIIANFSAGVRDAGTAASITIPPVLPRITSHLKITQVRTEEFYNQCTGPSISIKDSPPITASTSASSISYLRNPTAVVTSAGGEAYGNNSDVKPDLTKDRQQLVARVTCQAHATNGNAQIGGYAIAQHVEIIIDSVEY